MSNITNNVNLKFAMYEEKRNPQLIESDNRAGYVNYGEDNKFGDYIYNIYTKSSIMQAIINSILNYTANFTIDNKQEDIDEVIHKCCLDYILFGGFAVLVNRFAGYQQIKWIDFKNVRADKKKQQFYYSLEWSKYRAKILNLPKYDPNKDDKVSLFYFSGYSTRDGKVYPTPFYSGALTDINTSIEISKFWESSILNNLAPSAIISFNNGIPDQETLDEIEKAINKKFSGSTNAARTMISFNDNKDSAPTIERLDSDNFDQKYQSLVNTIRDRIFTSFRMNPMLAGCNFSSGFNKEEFQNAYALFYITVINGLLKDLYRAFNKIGIDINFKKLEIYEDGTTGTSEAYIVE